MVGLSSPSDFSCLVNNKHAIASIPVNDVLLINYCKKWLGLVSGEFLFEIMEKLTELNINFSKYEITYVGHEHVHVWNKAVITSNADTELNMSYELLYREQDHTFIYLTSKILSGVDDEHMYRVETWTTTNSRNLRSGNLGSWIKKRDISVNKTYDFKSLGTIISSIYRVMALRRIHEMSPDIKSVIFGSPNSLTTAIDLWHPLIKSTTLNESQMEALRSLKGPVTIVQGPPGTGKSTLISEVVRCRVPPNSRVLACTTANKAIDSLVMKMEAVGCTEILTVGREEGVGEASRRYLMPERLRRHPLVVHIAQEFTDQFLYFVDIIEKYIQEKLPKELLSLLNWSDKTLEENISTSTSKDILETLKDKRKKCSELSSKLKTAVESARKQIWLNVRFVAATASTAVRLKHRLRNILSDEHFDDMLFPFVIIDEAGAMVEPDTIGTLIHGAKALLLVGDQKQLPPFSRLRGPCYTISMMERLAKFSMISSVMMNEQYRMHPDISSPVSRIFYNSRLKTAASTMQSRQCPMPFVFVQVDGDESKEGKSYSNEIEAKAVLQAVHEAAIPLHGVDRVGVVTFYNGQRKLIEEHLAAAKSKVDSSSVKVFSVDSMQGRELNCVILSCCRTRKIGFVSDRRRLNVAASRSRETFIIMGDEFTLRRGSSDWRNYLDDPFLRKFSSVSTFVRAYIKEVTPRHLPNHLNCEELSGSLSTLQINREREERKLELLNSFIEKDGH